MFPRRRAVVELSLSAGFDCIWYSRIVLSGGGRDPARICRSVGCELLQSLNYMVQAPNAPIDFAASLQQSQRFRVYAQQRLGNRAFGHRQRFLSSSSHRALYI